MLSVPHLLDGGVGGDCHLEGEGVRTSPCCLLTNFASHPFPDTLEDNVVHHHRRHRQEEKDFLEMALKSWAASGTGRKGQLGDLE